MEVLKLRRPVMIDGEYRRHAQVGFEAGVYDERSDTCGVHGTYAVDEQRKFPAELHAETYETQSENIFKGLLALIFHQDNYEYEI